MRLFAFERRWIVAVLGGFTPPSTQGDAIVPQPGEADYVGTVERMLASSTTEGAIGFRLAIWLAALAPLWLGRRLATMAGLDVHARAALLDRLLHHRIWAVRELGLLLKIGASIAVLGAPSIRARSRYDVPAPALGAGAAPRTAAAPPPADDRARERVPLPLAPHPEAA